MPPKPGSIHASDAAPPPAGPGGAMISRVIVKRDDRHSFARRCLVDGTTRELERVREATGSIHAE